jgi:hypothetical protein
MNTNGRLAVGGGQAVGGVAAALRAGHEVEHVLAEVRAGAEDVPPLVERRQRAQRVEPVRRLAGGQPVGQLLQRAEARVPVVDERAHGHARAEVLGQIGDAVAQDEARERGVPGPGERP